MTSIDPVGLWQLRFVATAVDYFPVWHFVKLFRSGTGGHLT